MLPIAQSTAKQPLINEEIHEKQVRLIGPDNDQLGIMSSQDALNKAIAADLDLVLIAPQANPPVCRIMDYGKYKFEQTKREKEARSNQKQSELKEVRFFLNIDKNDFDRKAAQAIKFLQNGDKVKVKIRFKRARELSHMNLGEDLMKRFTDACAEYGAPDKPSVLEGKTYTAVLVPKAAASKKSGKKQGGEEQDRENPPRKQNGAPKKQGGNAAAQAREKTAENKPESGKKEEN